MRSPPFYRYELLPFSTPQMLDDTFCLVVIWNRLGQDRMNLLRTWTTSTKKAEVGFWLTSYSCSYSVVIEKGRKGYRYVMSTRLIVFLIERSPGLSKCS